MTAPETDSGHVPLQPSTDNPLPMPEDALAPPGPESVADDDAALLDGLWSGDEIEQAYLKAMQAVESTGLVLDAPSDAVPPTVDACDPLPPAGDTPPVRPEPDTDTDLDSADEPEPETATEPAIDTEPVTVAAVAELVAADPVTVAADASDAPAADGPPPLAALPEDSATVPEDTPTAEFSAIPQLILPEPEPRQSPPESSSRNSGQRGSTPETLDHPQVTPQQVIEAALFVGGGPLSARKLCTLLSGSFEPRAVEQLIDGMNVQYSDQGRPYEIRLGDGGYRLVLRTEFEGLRHRVYGTGPREVRLSQDVLEVLALVAYRQPVTADEIEACGKKNAGNLLRQLLRRELIAITRGDNGPKDVTYHTTPRFLQLFGLGDLDDLPRADDISFK